MSKLHGKLDFLSNVTLPYTDVSKPPRIITTCREGYGIEKFKERVCGKYNLPTEIVTINLWCQSLVLA